MELNTDIAMTHALIAERPDAATAEDWFEAALSTCSPLPRSIRNSWGDEEDAEEEVTEEDDEVDDEEPDPFEDFDEDDFDDEFDDDFEEELEDEYEIEPADDGMLEGHPDAANIDDDDEEESGEFTEDEE
jgi:hypothetical protein